jgi:transposase
LQPTFFAALWTQYLIAATGLYGHAPFSCGDAKIQLSLVAALAEQVQQVTGDTVDLAYVDQGYTGETAAEAARQHGIRLEVVKHLMAKRGFVLLPRRWVVERSFAWAARFRRVARDYKRLDITLKGFHYLSFACIMLRHGADAGKARHT